MIQQNLHVVFAGTGAGGHLFPGLAVAEQLLLEMPNLRVTFAGAGKPLEKDRVRAAGYEYVSLPCRPLPQRPQDALRFLADNARGYFAALKFLSREGVAAVVGLGGYASAPMARAAASRRVPFVLLEQNAVPGRAVRWLSGSATRVCVAFEESLPYLNAKARVRVTGNPIRAELARLRHASGKQQGLTDGTDAGANKRLLILGGSGGAQTLNQHVPHALRQAGDALDGWEVVHQTGARDLEATRQLYSSLGVAAEVTAFIHELPSMLLGAHLAISRAGGTTLAELAAAGVPAILIPFPFATDDHQRKNADVYTAAGGCRLLDQRGLASPFANQLSALVVELAGDEALRAEMSNCMLGMARPQAARLVAATILDALQARPSKHAAVA